MKTPATLILAAATALTLTACGASEPPEARAYMDMADWNDHVDNETEITCKHRRVVEASPGEQYRNECIDDRGRKALMAMYDSGADKVNAINRLAENPLAESMLPAILVGPNWTVRCLDEDGLAMCKTWQGEIGGDIRESPDY